MKKKNLNKVKKTSIKDQIKELGTTASDIWTETINKKTGIYFGERNTGGTPHGGGSINWENEDWTFTYLGKFNNGKFEGKGILNKVSKKNKDISYTYGGEFLNDKIKKGTCSFLFKEKIQALYEGNFKNNECHGDGYIAINTDNKKVNIEDIKKIKCKFNNGKPVNDIKLKNFFREIRL